MKRKIKVLYIERPPLVGGSVTGLYQLVRGLDATQYEPVVLFHGPNPYREKCREIGIQAITLSETVDVLPPDAVPWAARSLDRTGADRKPRRTRDIAAGLTRVNPNLANAYRLAKQAYVIASRHRPLAKRVARLIRECEIDLVHHNNSLPINVSTILAGQMAGVPQISHVRELRPFSPIDRYIGGSVDAFVFMSTAIQRLYTDLGIPPQKGHVIYDAFDDTAFAPASNPDQAARAAKIRTELGIAQDDWMISNVGRLDWWKGQDYFIQAIADIVQTVSVHLSDRANQGPGTNKSSGDDLVNRGTVKGVLIGAPDASAVSQAFYAKLKQMVIDLNLSEHIIFAGFRSDVPQLLAASDIVVHSSSEPEPFGRVVVEAMLAGRPVIATAAGGPLDIIRDQVTGLLVPIKNAPAIASAIRQLVENRALAEAIGRQARTSAQERFSIKQHVAAIQALYQEVLCASDQAALGTP